MYIVSLSFFHMFFFENLPLLELFLPNVLQEQLKNGWILNLAVSIAALRTVFAQQNNRKGPRVVFFFEYIEYTTIVLTWIGWIDPMLWTSVIASTLKHCFLQGQFLSRTPQWAKIQKKCNLEKKKINVFWEKYSNGTAPKWSAHLPEI